MERITPENSAPETQGRGGWCWYLPRIWRRSKKLVAEALTAMVYCSGEGVGSGISETVRSRGPLTYSLTWMAFIFEGKRGGRYMYVLNEGKGEVEIGNMEREAIDS